MFAGRLAMPNFVKMLKSICGFIIAPKPDHYLIYMLFVFLRPIKRKLSVVLRVR